MINGDLLRQPAGMGTPKDAHQDRDTEPMWTRFGLVSCDRRANANGRKLSMQLDTVAQNAVISRKTYNAPKEIVQKLQTKHDQKDIKYHLQGHPLIIT